MRTLRLSAQPDACSACRNAARRACPSGSAAARFMSADAAHLLAHLLRTRRERPRRRAAEQRDELAAPHGSPLVGGGPEPSSRDLAAVIPAASRQATRKARAP